MRRSLSKKYEKATYDLMAGCIASIDVDLCDMVILYEDLRKEVERLFDDSEEPIHIREILDSLARD